MSQITPDGITNNRYLGFISTHSATYKPKASKRLSKKKQMAKGRDGFSHMKLLYTKELLFSRW